MQMATKDCDRLTRSDRLRGFHRASVNGRRSSPTWS